ncbi:MAG TPA: MBOAT family O-acyltransferase, partial [Bdellovibrionales bacterium]|nr:MBOAT family O-acyltransferase [Bdellovibrionales bacterium]
MLFTSQAFLIFFLIVYGLYLILSHRRQNQMLLIASLIFYGSWDWRFVPLLLLSIAISYYSGLKIDGTDDAAKKWFYLKYSIVLEVALLLVFKYFNFFAENVIAGLQAAGFNAHPLTIKVILPLGISYYTFQAISYSVDVYFEKIKPTRDFTNFALFKSFFPILFSGPIERASNLLVQVERPRSITPELLRSGLFLIAWGLFKKMFIADNIAPYVNQIFDNWQNNNAAEALLGIYGFTLLIYCDFSGYTDMARGLGRVMGFQLIPNFNLPFLARNPVDFWRRWHLSLSNWMRDYVHYPVFAKTRNLYLAAFVCFFINDIWHGANWNV